MVGNIHGWWLDTIGNINAWHQDDIVVKVAKWLVVAHILPCCQRAFIHI